MSFRRIVGVCALGMMMPSLAVAQSTDNGFVRALGGLTFGTETSSVVGATFGGTVSPAVDIIGEVGYMANTLPTELQDAIDLQADILSVIFGIPVTVDVKLPTWYVLGGVRGNLAAGGAVTPFVEGGAGVAGLSVDISAEAFGIDISDEVAEAAGLDETVNELLAMFGGGVNVALGSSVGVDVGYRYTRIFTDDPAINVSAVYAAVKLGF